MEYIIFLTAVALICMCLLEGFYLSFSVLIMFYFILKPAKGLICVSFFSSPPLNDVLYFQAHAATDY